MFRRPNAEAGAGEAVPVEELAGIALALGRDIGMADDPMGRDRIARDEIAAQPLDRRHLLLRKRAVTPFVTGIDDLNAKRHGVEITLAFPARNARMECPPGFGNEAPNSAVLLDDIVGADPRGRIA